MNRTLNASIAAAVLLSAVLAAKADTAIAKDPFIARQLDQIDGVNASGKWKADCESLTKHEIPEWFSDAKLSIYAHLMGMT